MPTILPFRPAIGQYGFRALIEDVEYAFSVHWNSTDKAWYFSIFTENNEPIAEGIKVVRGVYFARWSTHPLFRNGAMVARAPVNDRKGEATFDDLGIRIEIWYFNRDELAQEILADILGDV